MVGDRWPWKGYAEQAIPALQVAIEAADKHNKRGCYIALINGCFSKAKSRLMKERRVASVRRDGCSVVEGMEQKGEEDPNLNLQDDAILAGVPLAHFEKKETKPARRQHTKSSGMRKVAIRPENWRIVEK